MRGGLHRLRQVRHADAPPELMRLDNNLAVIDYAKNDQATRGIERCPTGAIVWLDDGRP
jgi:electron transport complex protein RnfB